MARKTWDDVLASPAFQDAMPDVQEQVAEQYWADHVAASDVYQGADPAAQKELRAAFDGKLRSLQARVVTQIEEQTRANRGRERTPLIREVVNQMGARGLMQYPAEALAGVGAGGLSALAGVRRHLPAALGGISDEAARRTDETLGAVGETGAGAAGRLVGELAPQMMMMGGAGSALVRGAGLAAKIPAVGSVAAKVAGVIPAALRTSLPVRAAANALTWAAGTELRPS